MHFVRALFALPFLYPLATSSAQDLHEAAAAGDVVQLAAAISKGGDLNRRDGLGRTPLMRAAEAGSFYSCRELLWAGADANATSQSGLNAHDHVDASVQENMPLRFLLRAYAYLQKEAVRAPKKPAAPELVMILENSVNYMHPRIKAAYKQNALEALGADGKDDDKNGFIDDVWGWDPIRNVPYEIPPLQLDAYLEHREAIGKILRIHNDMVEGKLTSEEGENRLGEYTNPLAAIMGPWPGLSDKDFLDLLLFAAHGSHVAGIVLDASENKAKLHTLAMDFNEEARRFLGPDTEKILDEIHASSCDPDVVLEKIRARLLASNSARSKVMSRYLQATGAGIANMSFGGGLGVAGSIVQTQLNRCRENQWRERPVAAMLTDTDALLEQWTIEFYAAVAAQYAVMFYENPDVLFVVAAGNEDVNNDDQLILPAYLARFFPNVVTVAATYADDTICSFSNFGVESVDLGAPGSKILSTVIPEASVYMNGTSMATPYVAGVAALIRSLSPAMSTAELRRLLVSTGRANEQLGFLISGGTAVDRAALKGVLQGTPRERSHAQARIALNAAVLSDQRYPRHAAEARAAAEKAMQLDSTNGEAWHAKALLLHVLDGQLEQAFTAIERAVQLDPRSEPAWMERAAIAGQLGNADVLFASIGKAIDLLAGQGEYAELQRARRYGLRAELYLQVGRPDDAAADARKAREINADFVLSPELEALL
jgi:subtilisin family serine protease